MGGLFLWLAAAAAGGCGAPTGAARTACCRGGHELLEPVLKAGGLRRGGLATEAATGVPARGGPWVTLTRGAGRGIHSLLMERLMRPFSSMPMTLTLTSCPSLR